MRKLEKSKLLQEEILNKVVARHYTGDSNLELKCIKNMYMEDDLFKLRPVFLEGSIYKVLPSIEGKIVCIDEENSQHQLQVNFEDETWFFISNYFVINN